MCSSTRCLFTASRLERWRSRSLYSCETIALLSLRLCSYLSARSRRGRFISTGNRHTIASNQCPTRPASNGSMSIWRAGRKMIWLFYVLAGVAAIGVGAVLKWPRTSFPITVGTLILAGVTLGTGGYIAYAGGHVRHREFRFEAPPQPRMAEHHHQEEQHGAETHEHVTEQKPAAPAQPQTEHAGHEQMQQPQQPGGEKAKTEEEQKQLEASRLQLEASRLQLEASRKQLEAASGASQ